MSKVILYTCDFCEDFIYDKHDEITEPEMGTKIGTGIVWEERMFQGIGKKKVLKEVKFSDSNNHLCAECIEKLNKLDKFTKV